MTCCAIIVAAGKGVRAQTPKQFVDINGRTVLWHAVRPFLHYANIDFVRIVIAAEDATAAARSLPDFVSQVEIVPAGGNTRAASVRGGLRGLADDDWALVHDAARPCLHDAVLARFWTAAAADEVGGLMALPAGDALKNETAGRSAVTLSRRGIFFAQTPQMFRAGMLRTALAAADSFDDEAQAMERAGYAPLLVDGDAANIKITRPSDFALAAAILAAR